MNHRFAKGMVIAAGTLLLSACIIGAGTPGGAFMPRVDHGGRRGGPMDDISKAVATATKE